MAAWPDHVGAPAGAFKTNKMSDVLSMVDLLKNSGLTFLIGHDLGNRRASTGDYRRLLSTVKSGFYHQDDCDWPNPYMWSVVHKWGRCAYAEETHKDRYMKFCSTQRAWGAGRLRSSERASDKLGQSPLFCAGTALNSKREKVARTDVRFWSGLVLTPQ